MCALVRSLIDMARARIKNDNVRTVTVGYMQVGEFVVDKSL